MVKWLRKIKRDIKALVADREADIIELFERLPDSKTDLVIRCQHNRTILNEQGQKERLTDYVKSLPVKGI